MSSHDEHCADAATFQRIHNAFVQGDLAALRAAVDDPAVVPNGPMPDAIGPCLIYAIYHSPLTFIQTLVDLGADPNVPVDDGFPPLIAALVTGRDEPGATKRRDVDDVLRMLLAAGADPNQRGVNDYTALHTAVAERQALAVQMLLDAGADPEQRTRIDDYETPLQLAQRTGLTEIAAILARRGQPERRRLRSGLTLLLDITGAGELVRRQHVYRVRFRFWLHQGDPVRWTEPWGERLDSQLLDGGTTLITGVRMDRVSLVNGLFYGMDGMRVGGTRRLEIAPHLAFRDKGVADIIPPNALLTAEVTVLAAGPTTRN
jgi:hypothetical protein